MAWKPPYRKTALDRALDRPISQVQRDARRYVARQALERIKDTEARKAAEGETDDNHDNTEDGK